MQIDNRLSKAASLHKAIYYGPNETPSQPTVTGDLPKGKSNHVVLEFLPGIEDIACASPDWYYALTFASMEVVVGESGYKSLELECKKGARPSFGAAADFGGYTGSHPVEQARKHFSERLEKGDVVEEAGYPQAPDPKPVRVVRNGKVVAAIDYDASGYYVTYCDGQI